MTLSNLPTNLKPKSFWKKPEGVTGLIFMIGVIGGGGYLLYKFLPYLIKLLENTLYAIFLCVALGIVLYVLLDPRFRNLLWYFYKLVMRKITGLFVQIDPIAIIKIYVQDLHSKRSDMNEQIVKLKAETGKLRGVINDNAQKTEENLRMAEKAKEMGKNPEFVIYSREAGRLDESNKKLSPLLTRMEKMGNVLNKMYDAAGYLIRDMEGEVRVKEQEYKAIRASHSAMKSALNIINGNSDRKLIFDQAMEFLQEDMGRKVGEMERFMEMSAQFINGVDIQNGVWEEKGLEMLDKLEDTDFTVLLTDNKPTPTDIPAKPAKDDYSNLFN